VGSGRKWYSPFCADAREYGDVCSREVPRGKLIQCEGRTGLVVAAVGGLAAVVAEIHRQAGRIHFTRCLYVA